MAKLAEQAEHYKEMVEYMEKVVGAVGVGEELTVEERNLLSITYKNVIVALHVSWQIVSFIKQKEGRRNHNHVVAIRDYRTRIESKLDSIYGGILSLLDAHLILVAATIDSKVFYLKMKGLVMALIGSLLSILVAIVMPALCFLKIFKNKAKPLQIVLGTTIAALGIISAALGTYSSISRIASSY